MWEKIINYKYHLKNLKFMLWLFLIIGLMYAYDFLSGLMHHQELRWTKLAFVTIMLIGFLDIRKKLKNKDYRTT
ncbi:hypothetical protein COJ48_18480 [Bacillus cereus]|nr:hypothetical protein COJ48_18480 [Bacillus cereus]PGP88728.1 hypothetical protein CN997_02365 [Bacillus cereus]